MVTKNRTLFFPLLGITMAVTIFDTRAALAVSDVITTFVLVTDAIFSAIVTYIFLKPMLEVLQAAGGNVRTAACRRLERTKRWNFAGVLVTVGSSTILYVNLIAYFALTALRQWSLSNSVWGNPFTFGLAVDSILNTLGMILLCGMFKDVSLPSRLAATSNNKVAAAPGDQNNDLGFIIDSHAHRTQSKRPGPQNHRCQETRLISLWSNYNTHHPVTAGLGLDRSHVHK
jgi:hypothetical protein